MAEQMEFPNVVVFLRALPPHGAKKRTQVLKLEEAMEVDRITVLMMGDKAQKEGLVTHNQLGYRRTIKGDERAREVK